MNNPVDVLRTTLEALLEGAAFNYEAGPTRSLVGQAQVALRNTTPAVAHEPAAGIFQYDPSSGSFVQVDEDQAKDSRGKLRPGYQYLFKQHPALVPY